VVDNRRSQQLESKFKSMKWDITILSADDYVSEEIVKEQMPGKYLFNDGRVSSKLIALLKVIFTFNH
jgi:hypothetical protein